MENINTSHSGKHNDSSAPCVSIIIPTYNRQQYIQKTIDSIVQQTYSHWEVIIVDDGSTDQTKDVVQEIIHTENHRAIRYIYQHNQGVCAARNSGMEHANGDYIALLDSDDEFLPQKLEKQLDAMQQSNVSFSLSNAYKVKDKNNFSVHRFVDSFLIQKEDILTLRIPLSCSLMMFTKEMGTRFQFDTTFPASNDFDFTLRLLKENTGLFVAEPLVTIQKSFSRERISTNFKKKCRGVQRLLERVEDKCNDYGLSDDQRSFMVRKLLLSIAFYALLNNQTELGRTTLDKVLPSMALSWKKCRFICLYQLSKIPFLWQLTIGFGKFLWKYR